MRLILVLTSVLGMFGVVSGGRGLALAIRSAVAGNDRYDVAVTNQILTISGAILIAISIGFLALIEQLRKSRE